MNDRFPGLPDYTGPTAGMFFGVHHDFLFEYSHDINERLEHIDEQKPECERATRRRHIMLTKPEDGDIPTAVWAEGNKLWAEGFKLWAEGFKLWAEGEKLRAEGNKLWAEGEKLLHPYRHALEATWLKLVPNNKWNGTEIVFER